MNREQALKRLGESWNVQARPFTTADPSLYLMSPQFFSRHCLDLVYRAFCDHDDITTEEEGDDRQHKKK
jgi:hypothetical protein